MSRTNNHQKLQAAIVLQQNGKLNEAADLYRQLIKQDANNFYALHFLGVIEATVGNIEQAKLLMARSLSIQPPNIQFIENYATLLFQTGDYKAALQICQQGLQLSNNSISLLYVSAIALFGLNKFQESIAQFDKVLLLQPKHIAALNERGSALSELRQYDAALASIEKALALDPRYAEAHLNKGNVYSALKRHDEAIVAFDKALALNAGLANAWLGRGNVLRELKRFDEAFGAYDKALSLRPGLAEAWLGRGNIFYELKRYDEAFGAYDKALSLQPDLAEAWLGRGNIFRELKRHDEAFGAYDKALFLKPDLANAWLGRGNVLRKLKRFEEALVAYDKALATNRDLTGLEGVRLHTKMMLCDWSNFDSECAHLMSSVRDGKVSSPPFPLLAIPSSPADQLQCAKLWASNVCPPSDRRARQSERYNHDRIRIAYVSTDLHDHPVGRQIAALFEQHDKSRFEVTAISLEPDRQSDLQLRIKSAFEHFVDAQSYDDQAIVELLRQREIDIAVDLNGFTDGGRLNVFAQRPAPIQVNYLGYLGTMGTQYIDYIIGDRIAIPTNQQAFYSEKVVYLPNSFQANDRERRIADKIFTRAEAGLPQAGFVFCCFNNNYKIAPGVFDSWMRILKQVAGSVLWLVGGSSTMERNLRNEATARGINATRIVFAQRLPLAEYQARLRLADLFLDTLPYNAGATASDALWAGLPVLTRLGDTFVGRMAASQLNAIGLTELITTTTQEYETLAVTFATHVDILAAIKHKLAENRLTMPLFDAGLFAKHIEAAYATMYERHQAGLAPDHIVVAS